MVVLGLFSGLYGLVHLVRGSVLAGLAVLALGGVIAVVGIVVLVIGTRTCAWVGPRSISWTAGLGARTTVGWDQVARVLVPGRGDHGDAVALQLHDGRVLPVSPLRKTQGADDSTGLSPWYLRAGAAVQRAHHAWNVQQPRR
ncbi:hypothetical protein ACFQRD_01710 [Brachybacterium sp. GCM10030268]|uniref:hypothetical protein n=1 Tax=Brachybacterium sp. GCM10030268 TaxID=3273382 RepID=UPI0036099A3A